MPDISMCFGEDCKKRDNCYRYTAKPYEFMQSYMMPDPENCEHFWPDKPKEDTKKEEE